VHTNLFTRLYDFLNISRRRRELAGVLPSGRVLEVGVGRGTLLKALRSSGYQIEGIDSSQAISLALQSRCALLIHNRTLEVHAQEMKAGYYHAVIMSHVLEHLDSPLSGLRAVKHLLNEEGVLYIAVPNVSSWNAYLPGWNGYEPYHLHYFNRQTLEQGLLAAGFTILQVRTVEPLSGWVNTLARSIRRRQPELRASIYDVAPMSRAKRVVWLVYNLFRLLAGILLSPLRWTQGKLGFGEELVIIARPNKAFTL